MPPTGTPFLHCFSSLNLDSFFLYGGECGLAKEGSLYLKFLMFPICRIGGSLQGQTLTTTLGSVTHREES